jgi:hypothetical protein
MLVALTHGRARVVPDLSPLKGKAPRGGGTVWRARLGMRRLARALTPPECSNRTIHRRFLAHDLRTAGQDCAHGYENKIDEGPAGD